MEHPAAVLTVESAVATFRVVISSGIVGQGAIVSVPHRDKSGLLSLFNSKYV